MLRSFILVLLTLGSVACAEPTDTLLPDTEFIAATSFQLANQSEPSDVQEVFLWYFRSELGLMLNERDPSSVELEELRQICRRMRVMALDSEAGAFDVYGIEFVADAGDPASVALRYRSVYFFDEIGRCNHRPTKGGIS